MSDKLVQLYQQMADLTAPECAGIGPGSCRCPHSCCDAMACSITKGYALEQGVALPEYPPNPKGAFYLSEKGCTVAPHLRPLCTIHTCQINSLGFKPGDEKWTKKYFSLRNKIERLEWKRNETPASR
jgi:hypothetical protein